MSFALYRRDGGQLDQAMGMTPSPMVAGEQAAEALAEAVCWGCSMCCIDRLLSGIAPSTQTTNCRAEVSTPAVSQLISVP